MKKIFLIVSLLCGFTSVSFAQVWAEIINSKDSVLGSNSDNHVKIHNMPDGGFVKISNGKVIRTLDGDFVLCRLGNSVSTDLEVIKDKTTIYKKTYKVIPSKYSNTMFNPPPKIKVTLGHLTKKSGLSPEDFNKALNEGLIIEDTSCVLISAIVSSTACVNGDMMHSEFKCDHKPVCSLQRLENYHFHKGDFVFIEDIKAHCPFSDVVVVEPITIKISN